MANLQEKKQFIGGLDRDTDERFVKEGDYFYALNTRNQSSESNSIGVIQNIPGTLKVDFTFPVGPSLFVDIGDYIGNDNFGEENVGHGNGVPKRVAYFLPGSVPAGLTDFSFFASKTSSDITSSVAYKEDTASISALNDVDNIKLYMADFVAKNATALSDKGISVRYNSEGINVSGTKLPCLIFTSTDNSDILKIDIGGTDIDNGNLKKGYNIFIEEFKAK